MQQKQLPLFLFSTAVLVGPLIALSQSSREPTAPPDSGLGPVGDRGVVRPGPSHVWGDFDDDGLPDLYVVNAVGEDRLFRNLGDGRFEDATAAALLSGQKDTRRAMWRDFDRDGRLDLLLVTKRGALRLYHGIGRGAFEEATDFAGLAGVRGADDARHVDYDRDGLDDLMLATSAGPRLFHNRGGGRFEAIELELPLESLEKTSKSTPGAAPRSDEWVDADPAHNESERGGDRSGTGTSGTSDAGRSPRLQPGAPARPEPRVERAPPEEGGGGGGLAGACAVALLDQATSMCDVMASSDPTIGMLYPLSESLNVDSTGRVGIGTLAPSRDLTVVGEALWDVGSTRSVLVQSADELMTVGSDFTTRFVIEGNDDVYVRFHDKDAVQNWIVGMEPTPSITEDDFVIKDLNNAHPEFMIDHETGFVGIAQSSPSARLDVNGDVSIDGGINLNADDNWMIGVKGIAFDNTGGVGYVQQGGNSARLIVRSSDGGGAGPRVFLGSRSGANANPGDLFLDYGNDTDPNPPGTFQIGQRTSTGLDVRIAVDESGNVGIGTTSPGATLDVSGTTRMSDTLTLAPSGDQALDISVGSLYMAGERFLHMLGGVHNTAVGSGALANVTTGSSNTANGYQALLTNTTGDRNTAVGQFSLFSNTSGHGNSASGRRTLTENTTGAENTAHGRDALANNSTGWYNTALGSLALAGNTTGNDNIGIGYKGGRNLTTGSDNIAIGAEGVAGESSTVRLGTAGTHTRTFVAGVRGVTTVNADAVPVLVDSAGQLGTVNSSRRFKEEIQDMGAASDALLDLRPVVFRYKKDVAGDDRPIQYGLIAEEVAEVFPDLVIYDDDEQPLTVRYHWLSALLLNELQEERGRVEALHARVEALEAWVANHDAGGSTTRR